MRASQPGINVTTRPRIYSSIELIDRGEWMTVIDAAGAAAFYDYTFLRAYERAPLQETDAFFYLVFCDPAVAVLPTSRARMTPSGPFPVWGCPSGLLVTGSCSPM